MFSKTALNYGAVAALTASLVFIAQNYDKTPSENTQSVTRVTKALPPSQASHQDPSRNDPQVQKASLTKPATGSEGNAAHPAPPKQDVSRLPNVHEPIPQEVQAKSAPIEPVQSQPLSSPASSTVAEGEPEMPMQKSPLDNAPSTSSVLMQVLLK